METGGEGSKLLCFASLRLYSNDNTSCIGWLARRAREARSERADQRGTPRLAASAAGRVCKRRDGAGVLQGRTNGELAVFGGERAPGAQDSQGVVSLQQDEELSYDFRRVEGGCKGRGGSNKPKTTNQNEVSFILIEWAQG